jgi:formylglycine-generating enzyme required for sulfatase activity
MKKWAILGAMIVFAISVNAEVINISGKILKDGSTEGLAGARVALKKFYSVSGTDYAPPVCYTRADGTFNLSKNTGTLLPAISPAASGISVRSVGNGAGLLVKLTGRLAPVSIDILGADGRKIAARRFSGSSQGSYFLPMAHGVSTLRFIKISMNHESRIFKSIPGLGIACSMVSGKSPAGALGKRGASGTDSLVITKEGYRTVLQPIQSYTAADVSIPVKASQPWVPSASLEHQGGMVKILAKGKDFEMGQPCDTVRGVFLGMPTSDVEQPVHTVSFTHDFWLDTAEVNQGEFDSLMRKTYPSYTGAGWNSSNGMGKTVAVYSVLWGDCALFCNARSKCLGLPDTAYSYSKIVGHIGSLCTLKNVKVKLNANAYRLPTEAEWEYAARGGTATDFYWGKDLADVKTPADTEEIDENVVWSRTSFGLGRDTSAYGTHITGQLEPNKYGLYDMLGNVSEWCNDWYDLYKWGAAIDPVGPDSGYVRVQRGGNWGNNITSIRVTDREYAVPDYPYFFMGFRVAKQID